MLIFVLITLVLLVVQKNLEVGEVLAVDVSSIVAVSASVNVQIKYNGPMRRVLFGVSICVFLYLKYVADDSLPADVLSLCYLHMFFPVIHCEISVKSARGLLLVEKLYLKGLFGCKYTNFLSLRKMKKIAAEVWEEERMGGKRERGERYR